MVLLKIVLLLKIEGLSGRIFSDCRSNAAEHLLDFNSQDLAGIQEIQKQDEVFSLLVCSLCPTIYGQDMVKVRYQMKRKIYQKFMETIY